MTIDRQWPPGLSALVLAVNVAGCSGLPAAAPRPAPPNYAQMATGYITGTSPKLPLAGAMISSIQPATPPQPAEWFACVKFTSGEIYTVFYNNGSAMDLRIALPVDRCATAEGYAPFPAPAPPPKPAQPAKGKKGAKN